MDLFFVKLIRRMMLKLNTQYSWSLYKLVTNEQRKGKNPTARHVYYNCNNILYICITSKKLSKVPWLLNEHSLSSCLCVDGFNKILIFIRVKNIIEIFILYSLFSNKIYDYIYFFFIFYMLNKCIPWTKKN